jgi:DNA-binding NarL/FixJ family response regulator
VAMELHEWWSARMRDDLIQDAHITVEDLALLSQEWLGHGTKAIARALRLTPASIDSRFQRINAKLRVANRKAAARLAAEYGLIP